MNPAATRPESAERKNASLVRHTRLKRPAARRLAVHLRRVLRELGAAYTVATEDARRLEWSLDPEPIFLEPEVWSEIERAVIQRARVVNYTLADLYARQELLKQGLLPPELVLGDPFFRRPCVGMAVAGSSHATVLRFDLMRTVSSRWAFIETYANTPIGSSFAVQNRRLLLQERPDYYAALPDFRRVISFPIRLLDHLRRLSPRATENPNIVVLTAGPHDPAFFEHSFLARKMGLPLAQGGDLLVLDQRVFFKTVGGLVLVDVVYRRVNDTHIDPLVFPTDRLSGVPGLLGSVRAGNVAVVNAVGAGVADNRALECYLPRLTRYFLGERLVLPGIPTYYCGDVDQLAVVMDDRENKLDLLPSQELATDLPAALSTASATVRRRVLAAIKRTPHAFVARELPEPDQITTVIDEREHRETRLSCFALCDGKQVEVMPGGMVRLLSKRRTMDPPGWQVGVTRDLIVLTDTGGGPPEILAAPPERVRPPILGSRAADNLFWAGRYAERAEGTARMLSVIEDVGLEEISRGERKAWFPVWRGILEATGHGPVAKRSGPGWFTPALAWHMTLDAENASSLLSSVRGARENVRQCRDFFSPETWGVLSRLSATLEQEAGRAKRRRTTRGRLASDAIAAVIDGMAAFFGMVDRTMLHDSGWQFFQIGVYLERATMTCSALRHALVEAERASRDDRREDSDLTALVRLLSSQDAYRRTYQARIEPLFVAELFLRSAQAPKSIFACLLAVRDFIAAISAISGREDDPPLDETRTLLARLESLDLDRFFIQRTDSPRFEGAEVPAARTDLAENASMRDAAADSLADWLEDMLLGLHHLGSVMHDFYLSLQSRMAPNGAPGSRRT